MRKLQVMKLADGTCMGVDHHGVHMHYSGDVISDNINVFTLVLFCSIAFVPNRMVPEGYTVVSKM